MNALVWKFLTFLFGFLSMVLLIVIVYTYTNPLLKMYIKARSGKKALVFWIDKNKRVTVKELNKKNDVWEVDGKPVHISPSHFFYFEKTPVLFYYGDLATSIPIELVSYIQRLKSRFTNLRDLLKYQYEDEIKKQPVEVQSVLWDLLQTDTKSFIEKVKILGLKPKEEMFEFLVNFPIYKFDDLLDFVQNMRLDYFISAVEKKALSYAKQKEEISWKWIILIIIIVLAIVLIIAIKYKPEIVVKVPLNGTTINQTVSF